MSFINHIQIADMAKYATTEPTRQCLVCECKENPLADTVCTGTAWLCEDCKTALQKTVSLVK